jgi:predicted nuclease of predicted toxin-antitoxin system
MNDATLFAQLLCDIMIPAELAAAIRRQGYDVSEARDLPPEIQQDDWAILAEAAATARVVVTCNYSDPSSNFCLIHEEWQAQGKPHAGIILVPQFQISSRARRWEVRERLLAFLNQHIAAELSNQLWWLPQG